MVKIIFKEEFRLMVESVCLKGAYWSKHVVCLLQFGAETGWSKEKRTQVICVDLCDSPSFFCPLSFVIRERNRGREERDVQRSKVPQALTLPSNYYHDLFTLITPLDISQRSHRWLSPIIKSFLFYPDFPNFSLFLFWLSF